MLNKILSFLFTTLIILTSLEVSASRPAGAFLVATNDLDRSAVYYGLTTGVYAKYFSINTIIIGQNTLDSVHTTDFLNDTDDDIATAETAAITFHKNIKKVNTRVSLGKIALPIGLYEIQRVYPNAFSNRSVSDSFVVNEFSSYFATASVGALVEIDYNEWTAQFGWHQPKENIVEVAYDPRPSVVLENALSDANITLNEDTLFNSLSSIIESGDMSLYNTEDPAYLDATVEKETFFTALIYDNREDLIVDIEWLHSESIMTRPTSGDSMEQSTYTEAVYKIGVEKTFKQKLITFAEINHAVAFESNLKRDYGSVGISYDFNNWVAHTSFITFDGEGLSSDEYNIGATLIPASNVNIRIMYRDLKAEYISFDQVYSIQPICDQVCMRLEERYPESGPNKQVTPTKFNDRGLEFRLAVYF